MFEINLYILLLIILKLIKIYQLRIKMFVYYVEILS